MSILNQLLYRAKGDVMNEYKKQIRAESIDKETARADQLQNQADESLEAFENQDITKERIKPVKGIKLPHINSINSN